MRIVLLGATGFLGRHLLPGLSAKGHECIALSRNTERCRDVRLVPRVTLHQADVSDPEVLARHFEGADAVISMAGILNEPGRNGTGFHSVHVGVVESTIQACRNSGVKRLVHVSALNAGKGRSHYLATKGRAEELIRQAEDIDSTIVQPSLIFGADDGFFNRFASLLRWTPVMPLACASARLQPVWVGDVTAAICAIVEDPSTAGSTCPLVGPNEYTLRELVEFTARTMGLKRRVVPLPDSLSRLQAFLMDFVPGKPFSSDNYRSLQTDNTSVENALWRFGIEPRALEGIVSAYLGESLHQQRLDSFRNRTGAE
jgi:NADH dehydrogenase